MTSISERRLAIYRALDHHVRLGSVSTYSGPADPKCSASAKQFIISLAGSSIHQRSASYTLREAEVLCEGLAAGVNAGRRQSERV